MGNISRRISYKTLFLCTILHFFGVTANISVALAQTSSLETLSNQLTFGLGHFISAPVAQNPCPSPENPLEYAVWNALKSSHTCGNTFIRYLYTPAYSSNGEHDFNQMADLIREARSEVLFSIMDYDSFDNNPSHTINEAVRDLYKNILLE